jgi:hypothetical protein|eukprot:COSAG02_NODE_1083_length_14694_cov_6.194519_7_plen_44_part_00
MQDGSRANSTAILDFNRMIGPFVPLMRLYHALTEFAVLVLVLA